MFGLLTVACCAVAFAGLWIWVCRCYKKLALSRAVAAGAFSFIAPQLVLIGLFMGLNFLPSWTQLASTHPHGNIAICAIVTAVLETISKLLLIRPLLNQYPSYPSLLAAGIGCGGAQTVLSSLMAFSATWLIQPAREALTLLYRSSASGIIWGTIEQLCRLVFQIALFLLLGHLIKKGHTLLGVLIVSVSSIMMDVFIPLLALLNWPSILIGLCMIAVAATSLALIFFLKNYYRRNVSFTQDDLLLAHHHQGQDSHLL